jgi:hypothetical protein
MSGYKLDFDDKIFDSMLYAVRTRVGPLAKGVQISAEYIDKYTLIEQRIDRAYPVIGVEAIRFPHTHLNQLLDVMILALHSMNKNNPRGVYGSPGYTCASRRSLNTQKLTLVKFLASDVVTRMASLTE